MFVPVVTVESADVSPEDNDNWRVVQELFLAAADLPPDEQSAFLEKACAGNPKLREEAESLLARDAGADANISSAVAETARSLLSEGIGAGSQVGVWRI